MSTFKQCESPSQAAPKQPSSSLSTPDFQKSSSFSKENSLLNETVEVLSTENSQLKRRVVLLEQENQTLRAQSGALALVQEFSVKLEKHLNELEAPFRFTEHSEEDLSTIEEEGEVLRLRTQQRPLDVPLCSYHESVTVHLGTLNTDRSDDLNLPQLGEPVLQVLKAKDQELACHKQFIKKLKESLERILQEYVHPCSDCYYK